MSDEIFGIDLGTTNSCLAVMEDGTPRIIEIDGSPTVPSVVSLDPDTGAFIVGARARNRLVLFPESTIMSIKRRMGETAKLQLGDRSLLPEEIAAEILRYLKTSGSKAIGREIRRVVITVPAYFDDVERRATIRAGELAGLEVVRIVNEPTAASLVYERLDQHQVDAAAPCSGGAETTGPTSDDRTLLVYDFGGGTFDVSVVVLSGEIHEVRASCGDTHLGGDDFDRLIVESLLEHIQREFDIDLSNDARAMARLRDAAERAKIELSTKPYTEIMEEALAPGLNLRYEYERVSFETLIAGHLERTLVEVERAFHESGMESADIDRVVLVGGSTRIPKVLNLLQDKLNRSVEHSLDPDLCVALGAAVQGAMIAGVSFDRILIDVAAHSLGIKTTDDPFTQDAQLGQLNFDCFSPIIPRNTQIPAIRSEVFYTHVHHQEVVNVEVFQGEDALCSNNTKIGSFLFDLLPAPSGCPVVFEFSYDLDGIIHVVVNQKDRENRKEVTLSSRRGGQTEAMPASNEDVDNFIIRKASRLAETLPSGDLRTRLEGARAAYTDVLGKQDDDCALIDRVEDELLELLEEVEDLADADES